MSRERLRVLLVDESDAARQAVIEAACGRASDYEIFEAESAERALELLDEVRPDVVITAVRMAGMGGIELIGYLRRRETTSDLPIVAMTFADSPVVRHAVLNAGADAYLAKPFTVSTLRVALETALMKRNRALPGTDLPWLTAQGLLDTMPFLAMILGENHQVIMANESYYALAGRHGGDCPIKCVTTLHGEAGIPEECPLVESMHTGRPVEREVLDSLHGPLNVFVTPLVDFSGVGRAFLHLARPLPAAAADAVPLQTLSPPSGG